MAIRRPTYDMSPVSMFLDFELPKMMVQAAKEERAYNRNLKREKDKISATRVEEAIKTLNPNSSEEEFSAVQSTLSGFNDLYKDDLVMSEYSPLFQDMMTHARTRQQQNTAVEGHLDKTLEGLHAKIKTPYESEDVASLIDDVKKYYSENIQHLTKGEQDLWSQEVKNIDNAKMISDSFVEHNINTTDNPDDPIQVADIMSNNVEYQEQWDTAHGYFMSGRYDKASAWIDKAFNTKATSGQLYEDVTTGLSTYFEKDEEGNISGVLKGDNEMYKQMIPETDFAGNITLTKASTLANQAFQAYQEGDLESAKASLRKIPSTLAYSQGQLEKIHARGDTEAGLPIELNLALATKDLTHEGFYPKPGAEGISREVDKEVYIILRDLQKDQSSRAGYVGSNKEVNLLKKGDMAEALAALSAHGEDDWSAADDDLMLLIESYNTTKAGDDALLQADAALLLSNYLVKNPKLIREMDFKKGWGNEGEETYPRMEALLDAYSDLDKLIKTQIKRAGKK